MVCLVSRRSVDRLERALEGHATLLRVNIAEDVGRAVARRHAVGRTPTFIVFSPDGRERHRETGFPDTDRLEAEALNP